MGLCAVLAVSLAGGNVSHPEGTWRGGRLPRLILSFPDVQRERRQPVEPLGAAVCERDRRPRRAAQPVLRLRPVRRAAEVTA